LEPPYPIYVEVGIFLVECWSGTKVAPPSGATYLRNFLEQAPLRPCSLFRDEWQGKWVVPTFTEIKIVEAPNEHRILAGSLPNNVLMVGRFGLELFFFNSAVAQSTKPFFVKLNV